MTSGRESLLPRPLSVSIPSTPPAKVTAGDRVDFTVDPGEFTSAEGYSPVFVFRSDDGTQRVSVAGTDYQSAFRITISSAVTRTWTACSGQFSVFAEASDGTDRRTLLTGRWQVLPDPASTDTSDRRTLNRRILDAINAKIEGRASSDIASISIAGQSLSMVSGLELIRMQSIYQARVRDEEAAADSSGRSARSRIIEPRFPR